MSEPTPEQKAEQWMVTFGERLSVLINVESTEGQLLANSQALITMVSEVVAWRAKAEPVLRYAVSEMPHRLHSFYGEDEAMIQQAHELLGEGGQG